MKVSDVVDYFGNQNRVAVALGLSRVAVHKWVSSGKIPLLRQYQIERVTKGALKADE